MTGKEDNENGESKALNLKPVSNRQKDTRIKRLTIKRNNLLVGTLAFANFCVAAGVSLQGPFFPQEADKKGASPTIHGMIFGIYEIVMIVTSFLFGKLVPKIPPNAFCSIGLLTTGLSTIAFGMLDYVSEGIPFISLAFALRVIESIGATAFATCSYAYITFKDPDRVATIFSIMETCFGIGMIIGPAVGGALYQLGGYGLPFVALGSLLIISSLVNLLLLPFKTIGSENNSEKISVVKFISDPIIILDAVTIITALNLLGFINATLEPHLRQFNLSPLSTGLVFVSTGLMYAITAPLWGKICDDPKINPSFISIVGVFLCCIGLVIVGPIPYLPIDTEVWLVVIALLLFGVGTASKQVSAFTHAQQYSINERGFPQDASTYGLVSAMFFFCISCGGFIGPTLGGILLESIHFRNASSFIFLIEVFLLIILMISFGVRKFEDVFISRNCREKNNASSSDA